MKPWQIAEKTFFDKIQSKLKDSLLLYCLTGSASRGEFLDGWSDIDILIVVKNYTADTLKIVQAARDHSRKIKIGVTIYSYSELVKRYFVDAKTLVAFDAINTQHYKPRIINPELVTLVSKMAKTKDIDVAEFAHLLHHLKRELMLFNTSGYSEPKVYKLVTTLTKIILRHKSPGYAARSHAEAFEMASKYLHNFMVKMPAVSEVISDPRGKSRRLNAYLSFLTWLEGKDNALF